jgi:hypothetical protein
LVRLSLAVITGVVVAVLLSYVVLIVFVLTTIGIPLGAESRPLTATESALLLAAAAAAAAVGARTAARIARERSRPAVWAVGVILSMMMVWGFSGRNSWPPGWGISVAVAMAAGCFLSETVRRRFHKPEGH